MRQFRCFSDLWTERFQWQTSRLGVFCTKTRNWVAATNWENIPFHVWAAFIDNYTYCGEKRVRLVIYDCNATVDYSTSGSEIHLRDLQNGGQKAFIRYCRETRRIAFHELWIIGHPNGNPDGQCLQLTCQWVQDFLSSWPTWPLTADSLKQGGYIRIQLSQRGRRTTARTPSEHLAVPDEYSTPSLRSRSTSSQSSRRSSRSQRKARCRQSRLSNQGGSETVGDNLAADDSNLDASYEEVSLQLWESMGRQTES